MQARTSRLDGDLLQRDLTDAELELAVAGFAALWRGECPRPTDLLPDRDDVGRIAEGLAARGRAELDDEGRLVGIHGLTRRATRHRFTAAGQDRFTWCAFDTIGIPAALGLDATAHTDCGACHGALSVTIARGVPEPFESVLWIPTGSVCNLMTDFCATADLYCSPAHLQAAVDPKRVAGTVTDLDGAATLGRAMWAEIAAAGATAG